MLTKQLIPFYLKEGLYRVFTDGKKMHSFKLLFLKIPLTTDQEVRDSTPLGRTISRQK